MYLYMLKNIAKCNVKLQDHTSSSPVVPWGPGAPDCRTPEPRGPGAQGFGAQV